MSKEAPDFCYPPAEKLQNFFGVFLQFQIGVDSKALCQQSKQLPEETLIALCNDVLGLKEFSEEVFRKKVCEIRICNNNRLVFTLANGKTEERTWKDRSRSESWTEEMKEAARQKTLQRYAPKEVE